MQPVQYVMEPWWEIIIRLAIGFVELDWLLLFAVFIYRVYRTIRKI